MFVLLWIAVLALIAAPCSFGFFMDRWYIVASYMIWSVFWCGAVAWSLGYRP